MKTIIATSLILFATTASADWEAAWGTDELMINHEGHVASQSTTVDPIADSGFGSGNDELFAGHEADGFGSDAGRTAFDSYYDNLYENGV